ncbi:hypothetical protein ACFLXI_08990 [Chloroflexota bacterium]
MCKKENPQPDWTPEPFPEPRTIPKGWDPSAFSEKNPSKEQDDSAPEWKPDPFPEPRMFPWDTSN